MIIRMLRWPEVANYLDLHGEKSYNLGDDTDMDILITAAAIGFVVQDEAS
jgi:hypothetical protein